MNLSQDQLVYADEDALSLFFAKEEVYSDIKIANSQMNSDIMDVLETDNEEEEEEEEYDEEEEEYDEEEEEYDEEDNEELDYSDEQSVERESQIDNPLDIYAIQESENEDY